MDSRLLQVGNDPVDHLIFCSLGDASHKYLLSAEILSDELLDRAERSAGEGSRPDGNDHLTNRAEMAPRIVSPLATFILDYE